MGVGTGAGTGAGPGTGTGAGAGTGTGIGFTASSAAGPITATIPELMTAITWLTAIPGSPANVVTCTR